MGNGDVGRIVVRNMGEEGEVWNENYDGILVFLHPFRSVSFL